MIKSFLKAKHWQLFLLTFGIPLIFQIVMMSVMFSNIAKSNNPDPLMMVNYMQFFPVIMILFIAVYFGWFWSVAIGLQNKIPKNVTMKVRGFKIFFFIPLIYIILISVFMGLIMSELIKSSQDPEPNLTIFVGIFAIIAPLHLFSIFCMFYILYFVAKTIKTVELQREVKFADFGGEFFLIWFYPIGIWFLQPRINKIVEDHTTPRYDKL